MLSGRSSTDRRQIRHYQRVDDLQPNRLPRHLMPVLQDALASRRATLLIGPRQSGKSTLAKEAIRSLPTARYVTLDDRPTQSAAAADPSTFVEQGGGPLVIDEVQRVPELVMAVKAVVDRSDKPGQFLLTGSADIQTLPTVADALTGRVAVIELSPMSQGELYGSGRMERFIDRAFDSWQGVRIDTDLGKNDYLARAVVGGFPEPALRLTERQRQRWFDDYVTTLIDRDVFDIQRQIRTSELRRLLSMTAARSAQILNVHSLAADAQMAEATTHRYLDILSKAFVMTTLSAWSNNRTTRATHAPKLHVIDSGLLARLIGASKERAAMQDGLAGPLLETFVAMEIRRQSEWSVDRPQLHHYRTRDGAEVDVVLEARDGRLVGLEVKAGATVTNRDFGALRQLQAKAGDRFRCGVVLYTGRETLPFGDRLWCVPMCALWEA